MTKQFDILLKGGRVIDPGQALEGVWRRIEAGGRVGGGGCLSAAK